MKKIVLFAICVCFFITPVYSETEADYQKRQEDAKRRYVEEQNSKFDKFVKEQEKELAKFIKDRELKFQEYWGVVNEESFSDAQKGSDDEEPVPFRAKFSVCFNCGDNGADLQVANEDQSGTWDWKTANSSCEEKGNGWYLPTKDELKKIYGLKKEMGGFSDAEYWSISQEWKSLDKNTALSRAINFKDGRSGLYNPSEAKGVRCVRRMPDSQDGSAKKVVVEYDKTSKDESRKEEVQQPEPAPQFEDKTPKNETKDEKVRQPKPITKVEDKTPKSETKKENLKPNKPTVFTKDEFVWPVENYCHRVITRKFGLVKDIVKGKPVEGKKDNHKGIDIACQGIKIKGKPVTAAAAGKVVYAGFDKGRNKSYGNYIRIEHPDGSRTIYGHLDAITVNQGDNVIQGQEIGKAGDTGFVTGPHLHFEVRNNKNEPLNPLKYLPEMDPNK